MLPEALHDAVVAVAAGDAVLTPRITRDLVDRFARHATPSPTAGGPSDALRALTPREREVFALVATGLTNSEIAGSMYLTEATVKSHVTRLLAKLQLRDRVQVVIFAYERGLQ